MFRFLLPEEFQYFGLWGLGCYCLTGAISAKILQKFLKSDFMIVVGSFFFVTSFQMFQRMYAHTALAGHWIILLAILLCVYHDTKFSTTKAQMKAWIAMGILASSIHIYLLLMCGIILLGFLFSEYLQTKDIKKILCILFGYIMSAFLTIYLLGGFSLGTMSDMGGLAAYSLNLNGLFNPMGLSALWTGLPYREGQLEGFAYVGMGVILLLSAGGISCIYRCVVRKEKVLALKDRRIVIGIAGANFIAVIFALSPAVTYGNRVLFEWNIFPILQRIWGTFRATGRVAWISVYCLMLLGILLTVRLRPVWFGKTLLLCCCIIQLTDVSALMQQKHVQFAFDKDYDLHLNGEAWDKLLTDVSLAHWVIVSDIQWETDWPDFRYIAVKALEAHKTLNRFHMARSMEPKLEEIRQELQTPATDTVYIWKESDTQNCPNIGLNLYEVDGFIVGTVKPLRENP